MDVLEILGWAVFFYLMWQLFSAWLFVQQIKHKVEDALNEEAAVREVEKQVLALRFEHVEENGYKVVLAYGKNNKFLGQGLTEEEAAKNIQLYYPSHKIVIVNEKATITKILDPIKSTNG